jgi:hypothetical protein
MWEREILCCCKALCGLAVGVMDVRDSLLS